LIGCGFMGRTHSNAYRRLNNFFPVEHRAVLKAICDTDAAKGQKFVDVWGYERAETDWRKVVDAKDIDLVDICVPNFAHREIALAAAALAIPAATALLEILQSRAPKPEEIERVVGALT